MDANAEPRPKLDWADRAVLAALARLRPEPLRIWVGCYAGHAGELAPAAGPLAVDLSSQGRTAAS